MHYTLALLCLIAGLVCVVWYRPLSKVYAEFMARRFKEFYGTFATKMKWDDPNTWQSLGYKLGMIGVGLFFIAMALYFTFGTIHI